jgi:hypothetical protein
VTRLERRHRRVLRLLPAAYRAAWEDEMVATFLESRASEDPETAEFEADFGRPSWQEAASVAALAVRLRMEAIGLRPRAGAVAPLAAVRGEAVRALTLLAAAALALRVSWLLDWALLTGNARDLVPPALAAAEAIAVLAVGAPLAALVRRDLRALPPLPPPARATPPATG